MNVDMFKMRKGEGRSCLDVAKSLFGQPSYVEDRTEPETTTMSWHFYEDVVCIHLSITHHFGTDIVEVSQSMTTTKMDQTICGAYMVGYSEKKLRRFVDSVSKPWTEWTHDEIMESPMWVCLYKRAGNQPSCAMENMMHMLSFKSPEDKWVRKYFEKEKT